MTIVTEQRIHIYRRDHYRCRYCGVRVSMENGTVDHVLPRSRGGGNTNRNLVTCCHACNQRKRDQLPYECDMSVRPIVRKEWRPTRHVTDDDWMAAYEEISPLVIHIHH
jgi:5-methylcytosine-specific restriction endonuclease McrA